MKNFDELERALIEMERDAQRQMIYRQVFLCAALAAVMFLFWDYL